MHKRTKNISITCLLLILVGATFQPAVFSAEPDLAPTEVSTGAAVPSMSKAVIERYRNQLEKKIMKEWHPPYFTENRTATLKFELDRTGDLLQMEMKQSTGIPAMDESIQQALIKATPFKAFPKEITLQQVPFEFTFDYVPPKKRP